VRLSDYKGKVVLLDFWATYCGPCKIEIPWFMDFERKHKDKGFSVLGVSMDDDGWDAVKPFVNDLAINYRVMVGNDSTAEMYGGIEALPTTFLIDRDGKIASVHVGLTSKSEIEDDIEQLLQTPAHSWRRWPHFSACRACGRKVTST
jgi:peroxiredoxin